MIVTSRKSRLEGNNLLKGIYDKPLANITPCGGKWAFFPKTVKI